MGHVGSPLFRLPRELRDEIYHYYVREEEGYIYDPKVGKLRLYDGRPINVALSFTCMILAEELDGLGLQLNKISFRTMLDLPTVVDQCSNASWYAVLRAEQSKALRHMLSWARGLFTREMEDSLRERYPGNRALQCMKDSIEHRDAILKSGELPITYTRDYSANRTLLIDIVELVSTQRNFDKLTAKEYIPSLRDHPLADYDETFSDDEEGDTVDPVCMYTEESQHKIIHWKPVPWWIPSRAELDDVAQFIPKLPETSSYNEAGHEYRRKSYFSAAAVAIKFLQELSPKARMHVRSIKILEDHWSVAMQKSHAQGLIPFCQQNSKLRIERCVDIWSTDFIASSFHFEYNLEEGFCVFLDAILTWLAEARLLHRNGMPDGSFCLVLHGPSSRASQQLSDGVRKAAMWHEAVLEAARREGFEHSFHWGGVALDFAEIVKEVLKGEIPARFEGNTGELWDLEEMLVEHASDWPKDWRAIFDLSDFEEPPQGWRAARNENQVEVDWTERMDGWDMLVATV